MKADLLNRQPCVVDNMVLAMFVDAGQAALLPALAGGGIYISPSVLDANDLPPYSNMPASEFGKGIHRYQGLALSSSDYSQRAINRLQFFRATPALWTPVIPTEDELKYALYLASREARSEAKVRDAQLRIGRIDKGEAECAAIAVVRGGWNLWSDDSGIVALMRALHPGCQIRRTCSLVVQAINTGLMTYPEGYDLYENCFKAQLGLHSKVTISWQNRQAICV